MIPSRLPASDDVAKSVNNILATLIETRAVEYKQSASFGDLEPHIVKTAMAMANLRDGGYIVIGVSGDAGGLTRTGISTAHLATYDADNALATINKFASPAITAMVTVVEHGANDYLVIAVSQFERTPVICSRDGEWPNKQRVFAGTIFVRPAGFIETRPPKTATELDEVIDLAAEKRAVYIVRMRDTLNATVAPETPSKAVPSTAHYDAELGAAAKL